MKRAVKFCNVKEVVDKELCHCVLEKLTQCRGREAGRTSLTAAFKSAVLAPSAPSPYSPSAFLRRMLMSSIVLLQLMKRSKFSLTCKRHQMAQKLLVHPALAHTGHPLDHMASELLGTTACTMANVCNLAVTGAADVGISQHLVVSSLWTEDC